MNKIETNDNVLSKMAIIERENNISMFNFPPTFNKSCTLIPPTLLRSFINHSLKMNQPHFPLLPRSIRKKGKKKRRKKNKKKEKKIKKNKKNKKKMNVQ